MKKSRSAARNFCREFYLNEKSVMKAQQIQDQLNDYMKQIIKKRDSSIIQHDKPTAEQ